MRKIFLMELALFSLIFSGGGASAGQQAYEARRSATPLPKEDVCLYWKC